MNIRRWLALLCLCAVAGGAGASSLTALKRFVEQTQTAQAQFRQIVLDKKLAVVQESSGILQFSRPGKFRWSYEKPYEQLIVGDGVKLWLYDPDLKQVTVKRLDKAIGGTPAALLAGQSEIEKLFFLKDIGRRGSLDWLEATPKNNDGGFDLVRMGFSGETLQVMELRDHFGQMTVIRFSALERNPKFAPELFHFVPPKGADVIGD